MRFDVRWQSPRGKRVELLKLGEQPWYTAPYFGYVMAAKEWGLRPSELGLCKPADDLAVMVCYVDTRARMESFQQREAEKAAKRKK